MEGSSPEGALGKENMEQAADEGSKEHDLRSRPLARRLCLWSWIHSRHGEFQWATWKEKVAMA